MKTDCGKLAEEKLLLLGAALAAAGETKERK
jgi:hypothetical protein